MLFVMIMAIYAYRIYSNKKVLKENKLEKKDIKIGLYLEHLV